MERVRIGIFSSWRPLVFFTCRNTQRRTTKGERKNPLIRQQTGIALMASVSSLSLLTAPSGRSDYSPVCRYLGRRRVEEDFTHARQDGQEEEEENPSKQRRAMWNRFDLVRDFQYWADEWSRPLCYCVRALVVMATRRERSCHTLSAQTQYVGLNPPHNFDATGVVVSRFNIYKTWCLLTY